MSRLYELVREEVAKIPGPKRQSENYTFIQCPYHSDSTPSGRILHYPDGLYAGSFKCYGCQVRNTWNELAATLGLRRYGNKEAKADSLEVPKTQVEKLDGDLLGKKPKKEKVRLFPMSNTKAATNAGLSSGKWRTFKLEFLENVGCQLAYVQKYGEDGELLPYGRWYVYLPIEVNGIRRGYIKAQVEKPSDKSIPSYINSSGGWSLKYGLFPYDHVMQMLKRRSLSTIVLVEGPRDALRLIRFGIPALCIMGTHSWSKRKRRLLEMTGASRVILMFDGDKAGRSATKIVKTGVGANGETISSPLSHAFHVKTVRLWNAEVPKNWGDKKFDPGNCPIEILKQVKNLLV